MTDAELQAGVSLARTCRNAQTGKACVTCAALLHLAAIVEQQRRVVEAAESWSRYGRDGSDDEHALMKAVNAFLASVRKETKNLTLSEVILAAADRFDSKPLYRASIETQTEISAVEQQRAVCEAAVAWREYGPGQRHELAGTESDLADAIDAMRASATKEP